ncbi:hypothetical protein KKH23_04975 [Patescibacteria group bacterium]|nr:hypothetical protein [Patescibacteria group bacterium]MBU1067235.1 hypothetical protein [Patescibacteria group bacterium]
MTKHEKRRQLKRKREKRREAKIRKVALSEADKSWRRAKYLLKIGEFSEKGKKHEEGS